MRLDVRDAVVAVVSQRTAAGVPGVARLHDTAWRPGALVRPRGRGVQVVRTGDALVVTVRLIARRGRRPVIDVVRTVQRSVRDELQRLTGLTAEVVVVVVDLD